MSPVPFVARSEIHTIVTYDHETHFYVNKKKIRTISLAGIKFSSKYIRNAKLETEFSGYLVVQSLSI